jgi:hypothetical protein
MIEMHDFKQCILKFIEAHPYSTIPFMALNINKSDNEFIVRGVKFSTARIIEALIIAGITASAVNYYTVGRLDASIQEIQRMNTYYEKRFETLERKVEDNGKALNDHRIKSGK